MCMFSAYSLGERVPKTPYKERKNSFDKIAEQTKVESQKRETSRAETGHTLVPFRQALKEDLLRANTSQSDLARRLGVSQQAVSKWIARNFVAKRHRQLLANELGKLTGGSSLIHQSFISDQLAQTMTTQSGYDASDWEHVRQTRGLVTAEGYPTKEAISRTGTKHNDETTSRNLSSLNTHRLWQAEMCRQFPGTEADHLSCDPSGIKSVYDIAIPHLRTYILCTGTFSGYKPVRDLNVYSLQLVKQCAVNANWKKKYGNKKSSHIVLLNGICWRDRPTENEIEISKWLESVGISMIHVRNYMEATVTLSHFYHQKPVDSKDIPTLE